MTVEMAYHAFYAHTDACEQCERARPKHRWDHRNFNVSIDLACLDGRVLLKRWREAVLEQVLESSA